MLFYEGLIGLWKCFLIAICTVLCFRLLLNNRRARKSIRLLDLLFCWKKFQNQSYYFSAFNFREKASSNFLLSEGPIATGGGEGDAHELCLEIFRQSTEKPKRRKDSSLSASLESLELDDDNVDNRSQNNNNNNEGSNNNM